MSEGSEPAFALALAALARLALGASGAAAEVEQAVATLRALDSKWMLAYALAAASAVDLRGGRREQARARAAEALSAAEAVGRRSEAALARVVLARTALDEGDAAGARDTVAAAVADCAVPGQLSARAAAAVADLARSLDLPIPTVATTPPTTAPG
jgi:hypothetical protein